MGHPYERVCPIPLSQAVFELDARTSCRTEQ
jgi:hypothetical protein